MASTASARGFTLLETIVATGILVTALAGIAQLFILSTQLTRRASASGVALLAAQDKLESLRALKSRSTTGTSITIIMQCRRRQSDEDVDAHVDWRAAGGRRAAQTRRHSCVAGGYRRSGILTDTIAIESAIQDIGRSGLSFRGTCLSSIGREP